MTLRIRLLGRPSGELDGRAVPGPRGRKSWALLAVLLLADRPPTRSALAALLFSEADDPLGSVRWSLSQLRSGFHGHISLEGDPVQLRLGIDCRVDVVDLLRRQQAQESGLDLRRTLLEGADGIAGRDFELWLTAARHQVDAARGALLLDQAERAQMFGLADAVTAAARACAEPAEPAARGALVTSLVAAGDYASALSELRDWGAWIRGELRTTRVLRAERGPHGGGGLRRRDTDAISRIETGQAAMASGAVHAGVEQLRDAVRLATKRGDDRLLATALFALGGGLVHAVAAHSDEGAKALREAARLARRAGRSRLCAEALRDLAFVQNTSGQVEPTRRLLSAAVAAAGDDVDALSSVRGIEGMYLADRGQHARALTALRRSAQLAESRGRLRQAAWSISMASRSYLQRGEFDRASEYAQLCRHIAVEERWTAMQPWMDANLAELELADGRVDDAERRLRHAWSLSLVLTDRCWQAISARGLGRVAFARGDVGTAVRWLEEAGSRARQAHDHNAWIAAWVQDALCRVTVTAGLERAAVDVTHLARIAVDSHQPEFVVRAELHRAALGDSSALGRARALSARIDNPALA